MSPLISLSDYRTLLDQVRHPFEKKNLSRMLRKFRLTTIQRIPPQSVRLNSVVYLWHSFLRRIVRFRLVPPVAAGLSGGNLSALSPLGMAIFGSSENELIRVNIGGLQKELRIIKVLNK